MGPRTGGRSDAGGTEAALSLNRDGAWFRSCATLTGLRDAQASGKGLFLGVSEGVA